MWSHSDILTRMESMMPTLDSILQEVDQFVESEKTYADAPHIIDVIMPMLCSYLPVWWNQGPDNVSLTAGYEQPMYGQWSLKIIWQNFKLQTMYVSKFQHKLLKVY